MPLTVLLLCGCRHQKAELPTALSMGNGASSPAERSAFMDSRSRFKTTLQVQAADHEPVPAPPTDLFRVVHYNSPVGPLAAYLSVSPNDGKKHPAIIWIFGGFSNGIGETAWEEATPDNDQSARAFRKAGLLMMYPSRRGGNDNPGFFEAFYGEVDDVIAAADYLAQQPDVDPNRIYLGGHSTGGTLVLLTAACARKFRAVFSLGPVEDVATYGAEALPFDAANQQELMVRAPIRWLASIGSPTFVFEGTSQGNYDSVQAMAAASRNPLTHFYGIRGGTHFNIIAPLTELLASKVVRDTSPACNITFTDTELDKLPLR